MTCIQIVYHFIRGTLVRDVTALMKYKGLQLPESGLESWSWRLSINPLGREVRVSGKSWLSITMLCLVGTSESTGRIMSRHGLTSLLARPEDVLQGKRKL
ncbi:hypothetical protein NE237_030959 [Protea cynaroides]|uniref:Uncharacterized protein n=1 Tax=Protea cynaroides TaxID=273540 RepID=A0A9Q0GTY7_9MAGN|nr:hypothetical protein NE237_030959 [Protea cynaroides]